MIKMGAEEALINLIPVAATVEVIDKVNRRKKKKMKRTARPGLGLYSRR